MKKRLNYYNIFMTAMFVVIAGLLLASGIVAIQKSMKLNLSIDVKPTFLFEIYVEKDTQKYYVFRNFEADGKPLKFGEGLESLQGNKLSANKDFLETYGDSFSIVIANYSTDKDLKVTITSSATTTEGNGVPAEIVEVENSALRLVENSTANEAKFNITVPIAVFTQETYLEMQFEEFVYYTVSFNGNSGSGKMENELVAVDENFKLPANNFVREGYEFIGWTTTADGTGIVYTDTQSIQNLVSAGGNVELFAKWREIVYYVSFNGNGSTSGAMSTQSVKYGTPCQLPANQFAKSGNVFIGWNTIADGTGISYGDQSQITTMPGKFQTITLYAQWMATYTLNLDFSTSELYSDFYLGIIITNDPSFEMEIEYIPGDWKDEMYFKYTSSKEGASTILKNVSSGTPVATAHLGSVYTYTEYYQVLTRNSSYAPNLTIPKGYKVFVFITHNIFDCVGVASLQASREFTFTWTGIDVDKQVVTTDSWTSHSGIGFSQEIGALFEFEPVTDLSIVFGIRGDSEVENLV